MENKYRSYVKTDVYGEIVEVCIATCVEEAEYMFGNERE